MTALETLLEQVLTTPYHRVFIREDGGGYSASVLELEGVFGAGATVEEANQTLEEAMADWTAFEFERGHAIPEPSGIAQFRAGDRLSRDEVHERAVR